jgi:general secretion pathway protein G
MYFDLQNRTRGHGRRGFSLIEIMVVIVILGLLASAVVLSVDGYMEKAKVNRAKSDISTIVSAIEIYKLNNGAIPSADEGLDKLPLKNRLDPWGKRYVYRTPGLTEPYEVFTYGADGVEGGTGINADISSSDLAGEGKTKD